MELEEMAVFTEDVPAVTAFYENLFGDPEYADGDMATFDVDGVDVLVHGTYDESESPVPPEDHFAFSVDSLEAAVDEVADEGFDVFREPAEYDWGRAAYVRDPDGRLVEFTEQ